MAKKSTSKFADVIGTLAPAPPDPTRQDAIEQAKVAAEPTLGNRRAVDLDPTDLARYYALLRLKYDALSAERSALYVKIEAAEQLLVDAYEQRRGPWGQYGAGDNALRLATGDTIRVQKEPQGKVVDKEAFRLWCMANGYERQLQLWPSTMNSIAKERLLAGEAQPDGVEVEAYTKIVFVEGKE